MKMETVQSIAIAGVVVASFSLAALVGLFYFLWLKIRKLERRVREMTGEPTPENGKMYPRLKKTRKHVTLTDVNRISGYESAPESVILEENVMVASRERKASLYGKSKFIYQVYRTAQSFFANGSTETDDAPSVEDITIETYPDCYDSACKGTSTSSSRYSHKSGTGLDSNDCRKQMIIKKLIDSNGGQLNISGVILNIPAGALSETIEITLGLTWNETRRPGLSDSQAMLSPVIICLPQDIEFAKPVHLSFPHCAINALSDWTIQLSKSANGVMVTPEWDNLTLEDYLERDITESRISLLISQLHSMYCCTGESKSGRTATKSMSVIAYTSVANSQDGVNVKAYCVNDYSKCTSQSMSELHEDGSTPSKDISCQYLAVHNNGGDLVMRIQTDESEALSSDVEMELLKKNISLRDVWHDNGPCCEFAMHTKTSKLSLYQEAHESIVHSLTIRPVSMT